MKYRHKREEVMSSIREIERSVLKDDYAFDSQTKVCDMFFSI